MPPLISHVVRDILLVQPDIGTKEVIERAKAKGVTVNDISIRDVFYSVRSGLRKKAARAGTPDTPSKPVPAAIREIKAPKLASNVSVPAPVAMLSNVALVSKIVTVCGGIDQARQVAEAVRSCGSVDAFLQHLELVVRLRGRTPA